MKQRRYAQNSNIRCNIRFNQRYFKMYIVRSFKYSPKTTFSSLGRPLGPSPTTRKTPARARAAVGASHAQVLAQGKKHKTQS